VNARLVTLSALALWWGTTLLLSRSRWCTRRALGARLRPYVAGGGPGSVEGSVLSAASFRGVVTPLATEVGTRAARLFGVEEDLAARLRRVHAAVDPAAFRLRQLGWSVGALGVVGVACLGLRPSASLAVLLLVGAPLLAFLVVEQRLARASGSWQQQLFLELPIVCEQVGMLLAAGHSLGGALARIGTRGHGACARDLRRVTNRVGQGLTEAEALREWADLASVPELHQVVQVLSLDRATADLGLLLARESRAIRQEVQRRRVALLEQRAQQVWIPVTVATLVPGVIFLAVPFVQALRFFASS